MVENCMYLTVLSLLSALWEIFSPDVGNSIYPKCSRKFLNSKIINYLLNTVHVIYENKNHA